MIVALLEGQLFPIWNQLPLIAYANPNGERAESLDQAIEAAVKRRVTEEVQPVMDRLKRLEDRLVAAEQEIALRDEYLILAARREANLQEWAASRGLELPPPPLPRFREWLEDKLNHGQ